MIKMMIVGRRRPGTTLAQHHHHIRNVHGAMVLRYIEQEPSKAPQAYTQNRVFDGTFRAPTALPDPFALNRDFVTQVWFKDMAQAVGSLQQPFYLDHLQPDEDNFVDQATVAKMPVREQVVSDTEGWGSASIKVFLLHQRAPDCAADQFTQAWAQATALWAQTPSAKLVQRHVQNHVLARPGENAPMTGIDEFWVNDAATAHQLSLSLCDILVAALVNHAAVQPGSTVMLLAEEFAMYKGHAG